MPRILDLLSSPTLTVSVELILELLLEAAAEVDPFVCIQHTLSCLFGNVSLIMSGHPPVLINFVRHTPCSANSLCVCSESHSVIECSTVRQSGIRNFSFAFQALTSDPPNDLEILSLVVLTLDRQRNSMLSNSISVLRLNWVSLHSVSHFYIQFFGRFTGTLKAENKAGLLLHFFGVLKLHSMYTEYIHHFYLVFALLKEIRSVLN